MAQQSQRQSVSGSTDVLGIGLRLGRRTWFGGSRESDNFYLALPGVITKAGAISWFEQELMSNCFHQDSHGFWRFDYSRRYIAAIFTGNLPDDARQIDLGLLKRMLKSKYRGEMVLDEETQYRVNRLRGDSSRLVELLPDCSGRQAKAVWRLNWAVGFAVDTFLASYELYVLAGIQKSSRRKSPYDDELEFCFTGRGIIRLPNGLWLEGRGTGEHVQECEDGIIWRFLPTDSRPVETWSERMSRRWRLECKPATWGRFARFMNTYC